MATIQRRRSNLAPGLLGGLITPPVLLVLSGIVIALGIIVGPPAARILNGIGGLMWLAAAGWMIVSLRRQQHAWGIGLAALAIAAIMAGVVRPATYGEAILGFLVAGIIVALIANERTGIWAMLAPALYFPLHIAIAIGRVVLSGGSREVRVDPPPPPAFVPLAMILAAAVAGVAVGWWNTRRSETDRR